MIAHPGGVGGGVAPPPQPQTGHASFQASGFPDASQRLGAQVDVCVGPAELIVNRPAEYAEKVGQTAKGYYIDAPIALGKTALNLGKTVASEHCKFYTDPLGTSIRYGKIATGLADTVADAVYHYDQTWNSIEETVSSLPKTIDDWIVHTPLDKQGQFFGEIGWGIALGRAAEITFTRALSAARWVDNVVPDARGPAPSGRVDDVAFMGSKGDQVYVPDLSHVTGKTSQARSRTIQSAIAEDFGDLNLTHVPEYSPFIRSGVAKQGVGTQIGKSRFSSRTDLRRVIVHEELHHRWFKRGMRGGTHHADDYVPNEKFYRVIERYFKMRGWE